MPDLLSIIFERTDYFPTSESYGPVIDQQLALLVGGPDNLKRNGAMFPTAELPQFNVRVETHETGPIFLFEAGRADELGQFFAALRQMAHDWVERDTGGHPSAPRISIRYGPYGPGALSDAYSEWRWTKVTTDPVSAMARLDELIAAVVPASPPRLSQIGNGDPRLQLVYEQAERGVARQATVLDECRGRAATVFTAASIAAGFLGAEVFKPPNHPGLWAWVGASLFAVAGCLLGFILFPRKGWQFVVDDEEVRQRIDERGVTIDYLHDNLAETLNEMHGLNEKRLVWLARLLAVMVLLVVGEILALLINLALQ